MAGKETKKLLIPQQFFDPNVMCLKCARQSKEPVHGRAVQYFSCGSKEIQDHVRMGFNVGATSLTGYAGFVDGDSQAVRDVIEAHYNTTFWNTGKPGHKNYLFFFEDEPLNGPIPFKKEFDGYVKTRKGYSIIPPSIHPNGRQYGEEFNDIPVAIVKRDELLDILKPFFAREKMNVDNTARPYEGAHVDSLKLTDLINLQGFKQSGSQYRGPHPIHGSSTGQNFVVDGVANDWHCFRCNSGGGALQWIAVAEGIIKCADSVQGALKGEIFWKTIAVAHDKYNLSFEKAAKILEGMQ